MILQPMTTITPLASLFNGSNSKVNDAKNPTELPFKDMFEEALKDVYQTDLDLKNATNSAVVGDVDDLHTIGIASTKAALSLEMVVQLRNKALDSYNEIMRMGV